MSKRERAVKCFWDKERECPFPEIVDDIGKLRAPVYTTISWCQTCLMAAIAKELYWLRETKRRLGR